MTNENTVTIGTFTDYFQATLAKEILESNEISCILTGTNMSIIEVTPGAKIQLTINKEDREKAEELLESFF